ncbi:MAG: response regulator, partial [Bacteroidota bacterium]
MIRAFIVDDEKNAITSLQKALETFFTNVDIVGTASDVASAYNQISTIEIDLLFVDIEMGTESGFNLL